MTCCNHKCAEGRDCPHRNPWPPMDEPSDLVLFAKLLGIALGGLVLGLLLSGLVVGLIGWLNDWLMEFMP
jgi:hypothetical protein